MEELIEALQNTINYCTLQGNKDVANTVHYMEHTIHLRSCIFCHILPSRHCAVSANKAYMNKHITKCSRQASLLLTCQSRKSLSLTSPEVRIRRSHGGESSVYRHFSKRSSFTSLYTTKIKANIRVHKC